jgi:peptidyl-prolyl cis-trans isomerase D
MIQRFRGIVSVAVLLLLSLVFLVQFGGPQEWGLTQELYAAEVYDKGIASGELEAAFVLVGGDNYPAELAEQYKLRPMLLHGLVERSLLAREARRLGMDASDDEVLAQVARDGVIHLSMSVDAPPFLPRSGPIRLQFTDKDGKFSEDNLRNFIQYRLRRSVKEFAASQIEETLAQRMRDAVTATVGVGEGEVWDAYVREKESVTLKYVRFSPAYYGGRLQPTDAEMQAWMAAHAKELDEAYAKEKDRYTGLEKQVRARHVLVKVAADASDADKAIARAKAEDILARAKQGEDFAALAREYSEDEGSKKNGGDLGFNPRGRMVAPFDEAQFALAPGALSDIVESTFGLHVIKVEAVREGDVPVAEAKREIAEKLYRERHAAERSEKEARALHQKLDAGMPVDEADALLKSGVALDASGAAPPASDSAGATKAAKVAKRGSQGEPGSESAEAAPEPELDPLAPAFRDTPPFGRGDTPIPGPFDASGLVKVAFELTDDKPVAPEPMKLGDDWFVVRLEKRERAAREAFGDEDKRRLRDALLGRRRQDALGEYVHALRRAAEAAHELSIDANLLVATGLADAP